MKVFISGGCKNGKSTIAENIAVKLAEGAPLYYMATMIPHDEEDLERIARHIEARKGKGFLTVECGSSLQEGLQAVRKNYASVNAAAVNVNDGVTGWLTNNGEDSQPVFLVDSVTALLSNRYDRPDLVLKDLEEFCERVENAVFVSDFIYSAEENYSEFTEVYRKGLADCDRYLAGVCDTVIEVCAGQTLYYKGCQPSDVETLKNVKGEI